MNAACFSTYEMHISTLGKVHIGTGHDLDPTQYVIEGSQLYEFPIHGLMESFSEADRRQLQEYVSKDVSKAAGSVAMLRQVQKLIYKRRAILKHHAYLPVIVSPGVADLYRKNMKSDLQKNYNALEIRRMYRHPTTGAPVLPGSSIKGAIRTALLNRRNQGRPLSRDRGSGETHRDLERRLFQFRASNFHQDPMRLVQVEDAETAQSPRTAVVFAVNRKKKAMDKGRKSRSRAEQNGPYQMLEVVEGQPKAFKGSLVLQRMGPDILDSQRFRQHIPNPALHFTIKTIAAACNDFYLPLLKTELELLCQRGFTNRESQWYKNADLYRKIAAEHENVFLLRLGFHSSAEAVTIQGVRQIAIRQGPGQKNRISDTSTTLWLAASRQDDNTNLIPFGWVLVSLER